jgi:hypothetical protein
MNDGENAGESASGGLSIVRVRRDCGVPKAEREPHVGESVGKPGEFLTVLAEIREEVLVRLL